MAEAFLSGFALGLSLILAIGAQNAFVLRQGLKGQHVFFVVITCALSDAILIALGVSGFAALAEAIEGMVTPFRYAAAIFLLGYGVLSFRSAWVGGHSLGAADGGAQSLSKAIGICLALTWLNPHVYLDTVLLLGSVSLSYAPISWVFGAGAMTASFVFFFSLGYGAAALRPIFAKPAAWRIFEALVGVVMVWLAIMLIYVA